jgi:hypothetical protein
LLASIATLTASGAARAQDEGDDARGFSAPVDEQPAAAEAVLEGLATHANAARQVGGVSLLVVGSVSLGAGLLAEHAYEASYGQILTIAGALSLGGGIASLLFAGPMEKLAAESGPSSPGYTPQGLRAAWRAQAQAAQLQRTVGGIINIALGVAGLGTGAVLAAGVGDLDRGEKADYVTTAFVAGGAFLSGGIATLLLESDLERGFDLAYPSEAGMAGLRLDFGVAVLPSGGAVQVVGSF